MTDLAARPIHEAAARFLEQQRATFAAGVGTGPGHDTGAMIAVYPPVDVAAGLALEDGTAAADLHVTLAVWDWDTTNAPEGAREAATAALEALAASGGPMTLTFTHGDWLGPDKASWVLLGGDCLQLRANQAAIAETLAAGPIPALSTYAFTPHLTLGDYPEGDPGRDQFTPGPLDAPVEFAVDQVTLRWGAERIDFAMTGQTIDQTAAVTPEALNADGRAEFAVKPDDDEEPDPNDPGEPAEPAEPADGPPAASPVPPAPEDDPKKKAAMGVGSGPRWTSELIAPYGVTSGDKRRLDPPAGLRYRNLPLPFAATFEIGSGHDGAGFAGNIDTIENRPVAANGLPAGMAASGDWDLGSSYGQQSHRLVTEGRVMGVSIDLGDITAELANWDEANDPFGFDAVLSIVDGELLGLTHVMHPAFGQAQMRAEAERAAIVAAGGKPKPGHVVVWPLTAAGTPDRSQRPHLAILNERGDTQAMARPVGAHRFHVERMSMTLGERPAFPLEQIRSPQPVDTLTAAGAPALIGRARPAPGTDEFLATPPAEWFAPLGDDVAHAVKRTPEGEMFGLIARWTDCHVSYADRCVPPPRTRTGYRHYHTGALTCSDGSQVAVGPIFGSTKHPNLRASAEEADAHYHDTGALFAQGRIGENRHGIWFHGAVMPELKPAAVRAVSGGRFSGDWRPLQSTGWQAELISVLTVNGPGFATPGDDALVASGGRPDSFILLNDDETLRAAVGLGLVSPDDDCGDLTDLTFAGLDAHPVVQALVQQIGTLAAAVELLTAKVNDSEARERLAAAKAAALAL